VLFEWDEAKSDANYELRGFDFGYASLVFGDPFRIEWRDRRRASTPDDRRDRRFDLLRRLHATSQQK